MNFYKNSNNTAILNKHKVKLSQSSNKYWKNNWCKLVLEIGINTILIILLLDVKNMEEKVMKW